MPLERREDEVYSPLRYPIQAASNNESINDLPASQKESDVFAEDSTTFGEIFLE